MSYTYQINRQYSSNAYNERGNDGKIKFIILHSTEKDFKESLCLLQDKVSAHYLISENGEIFQLVDEDKRAWHAGVSFWNGESNLNNTSVGIEIVNLDSAINHYPSKQIDATMFLCKQIIARHNIIPRYVLGHSDIAPFRKADPGILFPWEILYQNGIGAMADAVDIVELENTINLPSALELQQNLAKYGYKIDLTGNFDDQTMAVLNAFRKHFCPDLLNYKVDKTSYATLLALIKNIYSKPFKIVKF